MVRGELVIDWRCHGCRPDEEPMDDANSTAIDDAMPPPEIGMSSINDLQLVLELPPRPSGSTMVISDCAPEIVDVSFDVRDPIEQPVPVVQQ